MNRSFVYLGFLLLLPITQCKVYQEVVKTPEVVALGGVEGLKETCIVLDTIQSVMISKAEALISTDNDRYEATVTLYAVKDSLIYMSAVNSGFEILRAFVDKDSIKVIDRLNKIVYRTPLERRFGYRHPVDFEDLQHLVSRYFMCDNMELAGDSDLDHIEFDFDENQTRKRISLDRNSFQMLMFEFQHTKTHKYIMGERTEEGFKIFSNFMITEFEILAKGGTVTFNQELKIKMSVNQKRYSFVNL